MGALAVIVAIIGVGVWSIYFRATPIEPASLDKMAFPLPEKPSIAVLPFDNISGDPEQDYIADGFTENIITGLSQIPEMFVIARNSVFTYKRKPVQIKQVSEDLGVRYVLKGSVQKTGGRLRVNAQLIDALKGHHLWAERYDREMKDLFDLQDEITVKIITAMQLKLTLGDAVQWHKTDNFKAWGHFSKGLSHFDRFTLGDHLKAREHFTQATKLDPDYVIAWTMLAWIHFVEVRMGWSKSPAESVKRSLELAQKASALSEYQAPLHSLMGQIYFIQGQYENAIAEGERSIGLDPNNSRSHALLAQTLRFAGKPEEAIVHINKAMRLEPYYPVWFLINLAGPYEQLGRYEEAIAILEVALERALQGEFPPLFIHEWLAIHYGRLDRMEEARAHAEEMLKIKPDYTVEFFRKLTRYKDKKYLDSLVEMLRKAGLPG
jgi:adenylate cyclase